MKIHIQTTFLILLICFSNATATNYYISPSGSDSNDGLSESTPFKSIQKAADIVLPGDTVLIMNGIFTNDAPEGSVATITRSGNNQNYIVFKNYPGHSPELKFNGWWGILIDGASYIVIEGLRIEGNNANISLAYAESEGTNLNNPLTSGSGIGMLFNQADSLFPTNIFIRNNTIFNCGQYAIYSLYADWVTIEGNEIFNNCFYSPLNPSAITQYRPVNSDTDIRHKMKITGNRIYNNQNLIPLWSMGEFVGGHAVHINNSFDGGLPICVYTGRSLVANNIIFNNGGSALKVEASYFVHISHNTLVSNSAHESLTLAEISITYCYNSTALNNIIFASESSGVIYSAVNTGCSGNANLYNSAWTNDLPGPDDVLTNDPGFTFLSIDPFNADFSLLSSSLAIDAGIIDSLVVNDFAGTSRPIGTSSDIGAYEFDPFQYTEEIYPTTNEPVIFQEGDNISVTFDKPLVMVSVFDSTGKLCFLFKGREQHIKIRIYDFPTGIYFFHLHTETDKYVRKFFVP